MVPTYDQPQGSPTNHDDDDDDSKYDNNIE